MGFQPSSKLSTTDERSCDGSAFHADGWGCNMETPSAELCSCRRDKHVVAYLSIYVQLKAHMLTFSFSISLTLKVNRCCCIKCVESVDILIFCISQGSVATYLSAARNLTKTLLEMYC